jgi:hypothetical protein
MPKFSREENVRRHAAAAHAMQTGVAYEHSRDASDGTPKHLRVGINAAMADHGGLVRLLIAKGVFTEDEYVEAVADSMEAEAKRYEEHLSRVYGAKISLY